MVRSFLFSTALLSGLVYAAPQNRNPDGDSSLGKEVAVSAPNGIPMSDTVELAAQIGTQFVPPATIAAPAAPTLASWPKQEAPQIYAPPPMIHATSTRRVYSPPAVTQAVSYSPPSIIYGSGSSNWNQYNNNNNGFESCVQQCMARFGPPPSNGGGSLPPSQTQEVQQVGGGVTHTVIVAPSQGVLRYVPFALNASVGDTISFQWRANNHYVARSSGLLPCNATTADNFFDSGKQNASFTFTQVINDTKPVWFFCATGTHCQQGMYGVVNPPISLQAETTLGAMMTEIAANNSGLAAAWQQTNAKTEGTAAFGWGNEIDMAQMPSWAYETMAENMLYNRQLFAANPEVMKENGDIDLGALRGPMMVPPDLNIAALAATAPATTLSLANPAAATAGAGAPASSQAAANPQGAAVTPPNTNAARSLGSSSSVVAVVAVLATLLAL